VSTALNSAFRACRAFWKLDEATGLVRMDSVGSNHLTDFGGVTQEPGKLGYSAGFKFSAQRYLQITDAAQVGLNPGFGSFSWSLWLYPTGLNGTSNLYYIVSKGAIGPAPHQAGYSIWITSPSHAAARIVGISVGDASSAIIGCEFGFLDRYQMNAWNHLVLSFDRAGPVNGYLDGIDMRRGPAGAPKRNDLLTTMGNITTTADFVLGTYSQAGSPHNSLWNEGRIEAVGYFNKALSLEEARALYENSRALEFPLPPELTVL
jgi:hypothetical protein